MDLDDDYNFDRENLASFQEQDLRLFKAITSDSRIALDFANSSECNLFLGEAKPVGQALIEYIKTYKTAPTQRVLTDRYKSDPQLVEQINKAFEEIPNVEFDPSEYQYDLEKFKQRYIETKFNGLTNDIRFKQNISMEASLADMEQAIKEIKQIQRPSKTAYTQRTIDDYLSEFQEEYVARISNPDLGQGALTGYSFLDYITNGLNEAELMIVAGETGAGKSLLLNNLAIQMWMQKNTIGTPHEQYTKGYNVLYFSLEMPFKACFRRTLARLADVPIYGLRDSKLTKSEVESVNMASRFIKRFSKTKAQFEIVDIPRGVTPEQIEERFLEAKARFNPDVVVVDYLGLMEDPNADGDDWLKLGYIAGKLHEFARLYNIRLLTAVQLNRPAKSKNQDPSELIGVHRIGRSSLIMHHANIGIQIESRPNEYLRDTFVYHIIKNRDGELGKHEVMKKFRNAAIFDIPYTPPDRDEGGTFISGFDGDEDISEEVKNIWIKEH